MKIDLNEHILQIANTITKQIKSPNINNVLEIKSKIKAMLNAEDVRLCNYDSYDNKITNLGNKTETTTVLDSSFIEYTINSQEIQFDNYITSNKHYNLAFDNPEKLSIRGLLIVPLIANNKVIGLVSIFRSSRQKSNFTKQDMGNIKKLEAFLMAFFTNKSFDKNLLENFKSSKKEIKSPKEVKVKKEVSTQSLDLEKDLKVKEEEIQVLLAKLDEEKKKYTSTISLNEALQEEINEKNEILKQNEQKCELRKGEIKKVLEEKETSNTLVEKNYEEKLKSQKQEYLAQLKKEINAKEGLETEYQFILENMETAQKSKLEIERKYLEVVKKFKAQIVNLEKENVDYLEHNKILENQYTNYKKIKSEYKALINDNIDYKEDLVEKENIIKKFKETEIKNRAKESKRHNKFERLEENKEYLLTLFRLEFKEYKNAYSMFEMFVYAFSAKSGMGILDKYLADKEIPNLMVSNFYRKKTTNLQEKKYPLEQLFKKVASFEKNIFNEKVKLNLTISEDLPMTLILDMPKIESVLYHLLVDFSSFMDKTKSINIEFEYKNKDLMIKIGSFLDLNTSSDSLLKNIFAKNNSITDSEEDRLGFVIAQQLLYILGAKLKSKQRDDYYQNFFAIPTKVLNMSMV